MNTIAALFVAAVLADVPANPVILRPEEVLAIVDADLATVDPLRRATVRYVWDHAGAVPPQAVSYAANLALNHAARVQVLHFSGGGRLSRVDLAKFAPSDADLARLISTWERFAKLDASFYVAAPQAHRVLVDVAPYVQDGKTFRKRWEDRVETVVGFGPHVAGEFALLLAEALGSAAPIVRADVFVTKALSTLDGGLYYQFRGFTPVDGSDRDAIFARFGVDLAKSIALESTLRATMLKSGVTKKPRAVLLFRGLAGLDSEGTASLTLDFREPIDPRRHPLRNLLSLDADAGEAFVPRRDSLLDFLLFDGRGELQNVAPQDIAIDPGDPHAGELQPLISCIRCHGEQGPAAERSWDGWISMGRLVPTLVASGVDVLGDLSRPNREASVDEIMGASEADLEKRLRRARDDFAAATFAATGGWDVRKASAALNEAHTAYEFRELGALEACRELGVSAEANDAAATLGKLLPPRPAGIGLDPPGSEGSTLFGYHVDEPPGVSFEDPILAALKAGQRVTRRDWEGVLPEALFRSQSQVEEVRRALAP